MPSLITSLPLPQLIETLPPPGQDNFNHDSMQTDAIDNESPPPATKKQKIDSTTTDITPSSVSSSSTFSKLQYIHLSLYTSVSNSAQLRKLIIAGDESIPECVMVNPAMVSYCRFSLVL
jgi:hypothetical protein